MSRRLTALAALCLGATLLVPQASSAHQAPVGADASAGVSVSRAAVHPLIQGVVVDQFGRPVDDVEVRAIKDDGSVQASAFTYASSREDGPQHGYFFLEVTKGSFTVELAKEGYRAAEYDAGTIERRRQRISMGEIEIEKILVRTSTRASLEDDEVTTRQHGVVEVVVRCSDGRPVGDVEVREGDQVVGEDTLRASDRGRVDIELGRLRRGDHDLVAHFVGGTTYEGSRSRTFTLTVVRGRH